MTSPDEAEPRAAGDDATPSTGREAAPPPIPTSATRSNRSVFAGCLKTIGIVALACAGFVVIAFVIVMVRLQQEFKAPDPIKAPVMWTSDQVLLSAAQPSVHGRLAIQSGTTSGYPVTVGLNVGAPATPAPSPPQAKGSGGPGTPGGLNAGTTAPARSPAGTSPLAAGSPTPGPSPADLRAALSTPRIRLTATDPQGFEHRCEAPCELVLEPLTCPRASCTATFGVLVELLGGAPGTDAVVVTVSGGGSGRLGDALPSAFAVDLAIDSPMPPGGS